MSEASYASGTSEERPPKPIQISASIDGEGGGRNLSLDNTFSQLKHLCNIKMEFNQSIISGKMYIISK